MTVNEKIEALRKLMKIHKMDAYLIDDSDKHGSEYVNAYYKERSFMSGFLGSNGKLLVLNDSAYLWTDGRYFLQADIDLKDTCIKLMKMSTPHYPSLLEFVRENLNGKTLGLNGEVFSYQLVEEIKKTTSVISDFDLVDEIWEDRGELLTNEIYSIPLELTGETVSSKLNRLREELKKKNATSTIIGSIDDTAYLYNLRGNDISITPVFLSFSYVTMDNAYLFINKAMLNDEGREKMDNSNVSILNYDEFFDFIQKIKNEKILVTESSFNYSYINAIKENNELINSLSPIQLFKAIKNEVEIKNNIDVHKADGLAIFRFMKYIKENHKKIDMDEYQLTNVILEYRKMDSRFFEPSFDSIAGWNQNGAIVHYEPNENNFSKIEGDGLLLLDSGGHYMGGTTDITRTYSLGDVTDEMKYYYTLVLKSHIDVAMFKFLKGATGINVDSIARNPFWQRHLDFKHGTGHGIGYMLNVHEGPNSIRWQNLKSVALVPGMITSNEPGIYIENKFGVRIENEVLVVDDYKDEINEFYRFDTITYAPIDLDPVDKDMLSSEEKEWLNNYHKEVYDVLSKLCNEDEIEYLKFATREI